MDYISEALNVELLRRREAIEGAPLVRHPNLITLDVPHPHAEIGRAGGELHALLGLAQISLAGLQLPRELCRTEDVEAARAWANTALGHAEYSPNYQRLLEHGDASDVGDLLAAGDEGAVLERLTRFRDAGVTDLAVRVLPFGTDRDERIASKQRTLAYLSSLCPEI